MCQRTPQAHSFVWMVCFSSPIYFSSDYPCALQRDILLQGRLHLSENWLCFYSNVFRGTKVIRKWRVEDREKERRMYCLEAHSCNCKCVDKATRYSARLYSYSIIICILPLECTYIQIMLVYYVMLGAFVLTLYCLKEWEKRLLESNTECVEF